MADFEPAAPSPTSLHPFEHEPAPPEQRRIVPPAAIVARGIGLGALATGLVVFATAVSRKAGWLGLPVTILAGSGALLSAWAALIHLTGGEKFDDHRWV